MSYRHDMSDEQEKKKLLPEGIRRFEVIGCVESTSKKGNEMFVITVKDIETEQTEDLYAIATPKKRWFLKSFLSACGVKAAEDGIYEWNISDVIGKMIVGKVEHIDESWVNRSGETVNSLKAKITEIVSEEQVPF